MLDLLVQKNVDFSRKMLGEECVEFLNKVFLDSIRVLEEVGFRCDSPEIREVLENTGFAAFDESSGHMHVLSDLVRQSLESAPKNDAFWLPLNSFGVGGTAPFFRNDATGELYEAEPEDIKKLAEVVEANDAISFSGRGVKLNKRNLEALKILSENTTKTLYVGAHEADEIAFLDEVRKTRGEIMVIWDIIQSPLTLSNHMVPAFLDCVRRKIPVCLASMPMNAISAPNSMTGLLIQAFAEFLAGLVIVQTVSPGTLALSSCFPCVTDIAQKYAVDFGGKYHNFANCLSFHIAYMLDIPSFQSGCTTREKDPTPKSVEDAKIGYAIFKKYGCHMIRHAFGFTRDLIAFSFEKAGKTSRAFHETDAEQAPYLKMPKYDEEAFEVILRNSSKANYMQDEHTLKMTGKEFTD